MKIYESKDYEEFVFTKICESITKKYGCTKDKARILFINALAYNSVVEEILDKVDMLADQKEGAA